MALPTTVQASVIETELERVVPKVPTLFEREDTFYSAIEKKNVEVVSAKTMRVPLEIRGGGNFGMFDADGGDLGGGSGPQFKNATVDVFNLRMGVEWTKAAEWGTDSTRKSVVNTFRHLLASSMAEFRRHCDSISLTDGTGALAQTASSTTVTGATVYSCTVSGDGWGARLIRPGQELEAISSNYSTSRANTVNVLSVDYQAKKVIVDAAITGWQANDYLLISGVSGTGSAVKSIQGVSYHHSNAASGTWLGLDRATYPEIVANGVNAGSSAFALPFARRAINMIGDRIGQDQMGKVQAWMHPCQKQAYEELGQLVSVIQKQAGGQGLDLYFGDAMQMAGAPVKTHFSWNKTRIDFVNPALWGRAEMHPAGFYEVDGKRIFELRSSTGVYAKQLFYLCVTMNLFHMNPAGASYIYGLTIPTGY